MHPRDDLGRPSFPERFTRKMLGCMNCCRGNHHEFVIGDGHASPFHLFLCILHHAKELGDTIRLVLVLAGALF